MNANKSATGSNKAAVSPTTAASNVKVEEPLSGWRILTTRASKQSGGLAAPLREMGAEVIEIPTQQLQGA
jgi:crotonobetainyl-CoA:carnitine CoA-transferase CaiB-like acyl-CoA transferase